MLAFDIFLSLRRILNNHELTAWASSTYTLSRVAHGETNGNLQLAIEKGYSVTTRTMFKTLL
jgi:hypothetical protein